MTKIKVHKLFPVPVFEQKLLNYESLNLELESYIFQLKKKDPDGQKNLMLVDGILLFLISMKVKLSKNLFQASKIVYQ